MPKLFLPAQVWLHWIVALLVLLQFLDHDAMSRAWHQIGRGAAAATTPLVLTHMFAGFAVLGFALWRIALRLRHGAPPPPAEAPRAQRLAARATHVTLYLLLLLLPISGLVAWYGGVRTSGEVHSLMTTLLLIVAGVHVLGAAYEHFVLKSDVLRRMLRLSA